MNDNKMNDNQLADVQLAKAAADTAIVYLDIVCKNCPKKRGHTDCLVAQAKVKLTMAALILNEIMEKERKT